MLLKTNLLALHEAIDDEPQKLIDFREEVFSITFKKIGKSKGEKKAASDAHYLYEMVAQMFDEFFTDKFPTNDILTEMTNVGFCDAQIRSFKALAKSANRK